MRIAALEATVTTAACAVLCCFFALRLRLRDGRILHTAADATQHNAASHASAMLAGAKRALDSSPDSAVQAKRDQPQPLMSAAAAADALPAEPVASPLRSLARVELQSILRCLSAQDICRSTRVAREWLQAADSEFVWAHAGIALSRACYNDDEGWRSEVGAVKQVNDGPLPAWSDCLLCRRFVPVKLVLRQEADGEAGLEEATKWGRIEAIGGLVVRPAYTEYRLDTQPRRSLEQMRALLQSPALAGLQLATLEGEWMHAEIQATMLAMPCINELEVKLDCFGESAEDDERAACLASLGSLQAGPLATCQAERAVVEAAHFLTRPELFRPSRMPRLTTLVLEGDYTCERPFDLFVGIAAAADTELPRFAKLTRLELMEIRDEVRWQEADLSAFLSRCVPLLSELRFSSDAFLPFLHCLSALGAVALPQLRLLCLGIDGVNVEGADFKHSHIKSLVLDRFPLLRVWINHNLDPGSDEFYDEPEMKERVEFSYRRGVPEP